MFYASVCVQNAEGLLRALAEVNAAVGPQPEGGRHCAGDTPSQVFQCSGTHPGSQGMVFSKSDARLNA